MATKKVKVRAYKKLSPTGKVESVDAHLREINIKTNGDSAKHNLGGLTKTQIIYQNPNLAYHKLIINATQDGEFTKRRVITSTTKGQMENDTRTLLAMLQEGKI